MVRSHIELLLKIVGISMIAFQLTVVMKLPLALIPQEVIHLSFAFVLICGYAILEGKSTTKSVFLLVLLGAISTLIYIWVNVEDLEWRSGRPTRVDEIVGVILIICVVVAVYKTWGLALTSVVMCGILYAFLGSHLPGAIAAPEAKPGYVISYLSTGLTGIFSLLPVSLLYIFLFVIFGQLLGQSGAFDIIAELGGRLSQRVSGGPALVATAASALVGTSTGSAMANVFLTGSFTIPMMREAGLKPEYAGAIEAAASTGGQIMPPVMGAAGFFMAYYIGVPYINIMMAAWLPALLYFITIGVGAQFYCSSSGVKTISLKEKRRLGPLMRKGSIFVIALGLLITLLLLRYSATYSVAASILVVVVLILLESWWSKEFKTACKKLFNGAPRGARTGAEIAMAVALIGMLAQVFTTTGLGVRLGSALLEISGGVLLPSLLLLGLVAFVLGTGLPTVPAYLIAAMVAAPPLIRMGMEPIVVHMFVFYFAVFSLITPPVAPAAIAASKVAGVSFFKVGLAAVRISWPMFFVPIAFAYRTELLLQGNGFGTALLTFAIATVAIVCVQAASWGMLLRRLTILERCFMGLASGGIMYGLLTSFNFYVVLPVLLFLALGSLRQFSALVKTIVSRGSRQRGLKS